MLESVFASKLANQVTYNEQASKQQKSQNVDMTDETQDKVAAKQSTRQRQLDYLRTLRFSSPSGDVNEDTIVRELLFVFQGIDGQLIKY